MGDVATQMLDHKNWTTCLVISMVFRVFDVFPASLCPLHAPVQSRLPIIGKNGPDA